MPSADIVFIHAPSVFDFRKKQINYGLISNTVRTTPIFECFPIGFLSLAHCLKDIGCSSIIVNIANRMLLDSNFNVEEYLSGFSARFFGLSLHWLVHAQGTLEIANILKKIHPTVPIVVGGITASYYHEELIRYPQIDFVIRGDSAELPLQKLLKRGENDSLHTIPNLTWKKNGAIIINPLTYCPSELNVQYDYKILFESMLETGHPEDAFFTAFNPSQKFVGIIPFVRGCQCQCSTCGGSNYALKRKKLGIRNVASVIEDIEGARFFQPDVINIFGDIRQGDWCNFLTSLHNRKLGSGLRYELFWPAGVSFINQMAKTSEDFRIMISPETHDEKIRSLMGRHFTNEQLETTIKNVINSGGRALLFFMIGLPHQDRKSIYSTLEFIEYLLDKYNNPVGSLDVAIGPLAPYIDPGSPAFNNPKSFGYNMRFRSLADHISAIETSDWREMLNYDSLSLDRFSLADLSWQSALKLVDLRKSHGLVSDSEASNMRRSLSQKLDNESSRTTFDFGN